VIRYAWIIPSLPAAAAFVIVFFGKRMPGKGAEVGIVATAASLLLSIIVLVQVARGTNAYHASVTYFDLGSFKLEIGETVDGLASVFFFVVCLISLCSQVYSLGYMKGDRRFTIYYAFLAIFTGSMLNLVIADNLFQLLVGWELVGICSYLLIGHWWEEFENSSAAIKAFLVTKTGDVPFLFGIFVLTFAAGGNANIGDITTMAATGKISAGLLTVAALLLFGGAIGKSAQFPLQVWLPDAMAGPTPVSALIHAATMVCAGVYLVGRLFQVFLPSGHALAFVGTIGAITMLLAASLALVQDDIKRVLAYSTVSQLAYMMAALGLGREGYVPSFFHLWTHAFFKALLFYGAGSVIHAVHSNNMSEMGGLRKRMPVTYTTFLIGSLALAGIPPLAGFFSKDSIIAAAYNTHHYAIWGVALATAFLTALYMARAVLLTFGGEYRGTGHPHESPAVMTAPMVLLAAFSVVAGFTGGFVWKGGFGTWLALRGVTGEAEHFQLGLTLVSVAVAVGGLAVGYTMYRTYRERDPLLQMGPITKVLARKYYMDDLYNEGIRRPIQYQAARGANAFDRGVVDGAVNGLGLGARTLGGVLQYVQSGNVQRYAVFLFVGVIILAFVITRL
jgi:NADH-quinone oxidoreductase subunit L